METAIKIHPCMCERQKQDLERLLQAVDDFAATVTSIASQGPQGYAAFIEARDAVRKFIADLAKDYRLVTE